MMTTDMNTTKQKNETNVMKIMSKNKNKQNDKENSMTTIRIPTKHQYAFIEFQVDGSPDEVEEVYRREYLRYNSDNKGIENWNEVLDGYLKTNTLNSDTYASMSDIQKYIIQEIKKSVKRINYENNHQKED